MLSSTLNKSQKGAYNDPILSGTNPFAPSGTGSYDATTNDDWGGLLWLFLGLM